MSQYRNAKVTGTVIFDGVALSDARLAGATISDVSERLLRGTP